MTIRAGATAITAAVLVILSGCSGQDQSTSTGSSRASVTQTAPSVWSPPDTGSAAPSSTADGDLSAAESTLPGLSADCTAAIRAQLAVNDLFGNALKRPVTLSADQDAAARATATDAPPALTKTAIAATFDPIEATIPSALRSSFATLRTAADALTTKAAQDVPDVLEAPDAAGAMSTIADYITACQPATTD